VLQVAEELGDVDRQLLVLSNRTYVEKLAGEYGTALVLAARLQTLAAAHGVPLHVGRLDTIVRALTGLDRLDETEAALGPGADLLLTLAKVRRGRGHVPQAQEALDECVRRCHQHGRASLRVRPRGAEPGPEHRRGLAAGGGPAPRRRRTPLERARRRPG
jgi:two-component system cell cycle response regulator